MPRSFRRRRPLRRHPELPPLPAPAILRAAEGTRRQAARPRLRVRHRRRTSAPPAAGPARTHHLPQDLLLSFIAVTPASAVAIRPAACASRPDHLSCARVARDRAHSPLLEILDAHRTGGRHTLPDRSRSTNESRCWSCAHHELCLQGPNAYMVPTFQSCRMLTSSTR